MKSIMRLCVVFFAFGFFYPAVFVSAQPAPSQEAGGVLRQQSDIERQNIYGRRIQIWETEKKKEEPVPPEEQVSQMSSAPRVRVNEVKVEGGNVLTQKEVDDVLAGSFTPGDEMTFAQMQSLAGEMTAVYRRKGFVTSRAYIPPQPLDQGVLTIRVIEGRMGQYAISGNRYFTTRQLEKKFRIKQGEIFDYKELQRSIETINRVPDRQARVVLVPGRQSGETDVNVQVQDQFPGHVTLEYDNWASRYLNKDRMGITLEHNNLTRHDDRLSVKFLFSEGDNLELWQGRYTHPLTNVLDVGVHWTTSRTHLGSEFETLQADGDAEVFGLFAVRELVNETDVNVNLNAGLDVKNIRNDLLGSVNSKDKIRVGRVGLDTDLDDPWGRSIASLEWDFGIPGLWNAMDDENDPLASRAGAGAEFSKFLGNFFRLQPFPSDIRYLNESYILWKNFGQYSDDILTASEQFQIGGATSVRGYGPGERAGDSGIYSSLEWSFPFYGLSRSLEMPGRKEKLYDSLRFVAFYDVGWTDLQRPQAGEKKQNTLRGYGAGVRLNISRDIAMRIEVGWPDGRKSDDGRRAHPWVEFDWKF